MIFALVVTFAFFLGLLAGFLFAIVCYPDKQDIIDRINRDRDR